MKKIIIKKIGITNIQADAIVNAANSGLLAGGGVCGAIFSAAGHNELQDACDKIGHCDEGSAVITDGFKLKAKYIIHAVGPQWIDGNHNEPQHLYGAYRRSLELAVEYGCKSIAFPLISAGIFGYPLEGAWRKALQSCNDFLDKNNCNLEIIFTILDDRIMSEGIKQSKEIAKKYIEDTDIADAKQSFSILNINGYNHNAVFFHKPEEPYGYLSNWFMSDFVIDGIKFTSNEQYIMYQKCLICGDTASANAVLATNDVAEVKDIGKKAKGYNDTVWSGMRQLIAFKGLYAKFTQDDTLKKKLLDTGDAYLVECAISDRIWACGISLYDDSRCDISKWQGQNILGFALMNVREKIKGEFCI